MAKTAREIALEFLPLDNQTTAELADAIDDTLTCTLVGAREEVAHAVRRVLDEWTE